MKVQDISHLENRKICFDGVFCSWRVVLTVGPDVQNRQLVLSPYQVEVILAV